MLSGGLERRFSGSFRPLAEQPSQPGGAGGIGTGVKNTAIFPLFASRNRSLGQARTFPFAAHRAEAWALDERGQRKTQLSVEADTNGNAVVAIGPQYRTLWYEVSAKQAGTRSVSWPK